MFLYCFYAKEQQQPFFKKGKESSGGNSLPLTRKKPWNRVNLPVYSISSSSEGKVNMNIITYASAISMKPKRFICCIYQDTQTLINVQKQHAFVLQILSSEQYGLVKLLGKQSGKITDKMKQLEKKNELTNWNGYTVLRNALAVMEMKVSDCFDAGDHIGFVCDVVAYKNLQHGHALNLDILRKKKLISA